MRNDVGASRCYNVGTALVGEMLLNGPRPIGWSRVTCTPLDIHSPLATGPRIICTRMPRLRATVATATDMTSPFYTVITKVYTRAPEHVRVDSDRVKSANEPEFTSICTIPDQDASRKQRSFVFVCDRLPLLAWSGSTFTGARGGAAANRFYDTTRTREEDRPQIAGGLLTLILTREFNRNM